MKTLTTVISAGCSGGALVYFVASLCVRDNQKRVELRLTAICLWQVAIVNLI